MSDTIVGELHQASQFLCDDGYNKHENPIRAIDNAAAELTRLRALVVELRTALQELYDVQTVAPYTEDVDYDRAVAQAKAALDKE